MSTYKLASGNTPTQATAQEMLDHCNKATSVGRYSAVCGRVREKIGESQGCTHSRAGKELSKEFVDGKVAKITKNLARRRTHLRLSVATHQHLRTHSWVLRVLFTRRLTSAICLETSRRF